MELLRTFNVLMNTEYFIIKLFLKYNKIKINNIMFYKILGFHRHQDFVKSFRRATRDEPQDSVKEGTKPTLVTSHHPPCSKRQDWYTVLSGVFPLACQSS